MFFAQYCALNKSWYLPTQHRRHLYFVSDMGKRKLACATEPCPKKSRQQRFRAEYTQRYPCIIKSKLSESHARCTICNSDIKIAHGGADNLGHHVTSKGHLDKG